MRGDKAAQVVCYRTQCEQLPMHWLAHVQTQLSLQGSEVGLKGDLCEADRCGVPVWTGCDVAGHLGSPWSGAGQTPVGRTH